MTNVTMRSTSITVPSELASVAETLMRGESVTVPVRTLLAWFGESRRSIAAITRVAKVLSAHALSTEPDFADAWIDEPVRLRSAAGEPPATLPPTARAPVSGTSSSVPAPLASEPAATPGDAPPRARGGRDLVHRVGAIAAAHRPLQSLSPDKTLAEALSLMRLRDAAYVALTTHEDRQLHGVVTWRSAAKGLLVGAQTQPARNCAEPTYTCNLEDDIFVVARAVRGGGVAFVRAADKKYRGPVSYEDLVEEFGTRLEPFLLAGEVEGALRQIVEARLAEAVAELKSRTSSGVGLTLGECQMLLQNPANFDRTEIPFVRAQFNAVLDEVRVVRNELMHFSTDDAVDSEKVHALRRFARALREIAGASRAPS